MRTPRFVLLLFAVAAIAVGVSACQREQARAPAAVVGDNTRPAQTVLLLTRRLHDNDLKAFARDAVPPALHAQLVTAWREGRTRWPLQELPFDERLPQLLAALAEPGSEQRLQKVFDQQFAGAHAEIKAAASALGLFGVQYVQQDKDYSAAERAHYAQFVAALSRWAAAAPLGDPQRARKAIPQLTRAARAVGLTSDADFAKAGMPTSLRRLGAFLGAGKQVLALYGLQLDDSLADLQATLQSQTGDTAQVRMRYTLGGEPIDTVVELERHDGRWYLSDYLRHAEHAVEEQAVARPAAQTP